MHRARRAWSSHLSAEGEEGLKALVTGATGYIGSHLAAALRRRGDAVRIAARDAGRASALERLGCDVRLVDLEATDAAALARVVDGTEVVFHLASAMYGAPDRFERVDVRGTELLLKAACAAQARRLVYVSTISSYPLAGMQDGAVIDETCPFDETGQLGPYPRAKVRAERAVLQANARGGLECVIVRLGQVCGAGYPVFLPQVGQRVGASCMLLFGDGTVPLPLVHIDNAVDALVRAAETRGIAGESFNVVDDERITQDEYLRLLRSETGGMPRVVRLPRLAYYAMGAVAELAAAARGKDPATNRHRVRTRLRHARWDCSKAKHVLGWSPRAPLKDGLTAAFRDYAGQLSSAARSPA